MCVFIILSFQEEVVKILIFLSICLKWHASIKNLATSQKTFGQT